MARQLTIDDVRRMINRKVHRDLSEPIKEIGGVINRHKLTYDEFLSIADVMIQSYDAMRELSKGGN